MLDVTSYRFRQSCEAIDLSPDSSLALGKVIWKTGLQFYSLQDAVQEIENVIYNLTLMAL